MGKEAGVLNLDKPPYLTDLDNHVLIGGFLMALALSIPADIIDPA